MKEFKEGDRVLAYDPITQRWGAGVYNLKLDDAFVVLSLGSAMPALFLPKHIYPDSPEGYAKLIRFLHKEIEHLQDEAKRAAAVLDIAEEGKEYGCINGHEFDDPKLVKTLEFYPFAEVEICPSCGEEDIHKN